MKEPYRSQALLLSRILGGGALLLAGLIKLKGGPLVFQLSIESFKLLPDFAPLPLAYLLPWTEVVFGAALLLGVWSRQAALMVLGIYVAFTLGLASVLLRGISVDCGCFGGLFGESKVSWLSIARNVVFIIATSVNLVFGGGRFTLTRESS